MRNINVDNLGDDIDIKGWVSPLLEFQSYVENNIDDINNIRFYDNSVGEENALDFLSYIVRKCTIVGPDKWDVEGLNAWLDAQQALEIKIRDNLDQALDIYINRSSIDNKYPEVLKMLFAKGLNPNCTYEDKPLIFTLIDSAWEGDTVNPEALEVLLKQEVLNVNITIGTRDKPEHCQIGCTPLHLATWRAEPNCMGGKPELMEAIIKMLLGAGADPEIQSTIATNDITFDFTIDEHLSFLELAAKLGIGWTEETFREPEPEVIENIAPEIIQVINVVNLEEFIQSVNDNIADINNVRFYGAGLNEANSLDFLSYIVRRCTSTGADVWNLDNLDPDNVNPILTLLNNDALQGAIIDNLDQALDIYIKRTNSMDDKYPEVLQMLFNKALDPNTVYEDKPLIFTLIDRAWEGDRLNTEALDILLAQPGLNIDVAIGTEDYPIHDQIGCTPLHWATWRAEAAHMGGCPALMQMVIQRLLDAGANPSIKSIISENGEDVDFIEHDGAEVNFLQLAARLDGGAAPEEAKIGWTAESFALTIPLEPVIDDPINLPTKRPIYYSMGIVTAAILPAAGLQAIFIQLDLINEINKASSSAVLGSIVNVSSIALVSGGFAFFTNLIADKVAGDELNAKRALINAGLIFAANALIMTGIEISINFSAIASEYAAALKITGIVAMIIADVIMTEFATPAIEDAVIR